MMQEVDNRTVAILIVRMMGYYTCERSFGGAGTANALTTPAPWNRS